MVKVQEIYGSWLSQYEWTYWTTCTTRYQLTLPSARRLMQRFWNNTDLVKSGAARMFWCAEPFDTRVGYHTHALIKFNDILSLKNVAEIYQFACGNVDISKDQWHRIDLKPYNSKLGAGYYCGKYITKNLADFDFWERN